MKRIMGGLAALAVAGGVAVAAPVHADYKPQGTRGDHSTELYLQEMLAVGLNGSYVDAFSMAARTCTNLQGGTSEDELISTDISFAGATRAQAEAQVHGAEWHFCPSYYGR
jgi:hypothetical protein